MEIKNLLNHIFKDKKFNYSKITTGKFNESYFVSAGGKEYVLRIAPPSETPVLFYEREMMRREPGIHSLILEKTDVPVAGIIEYDFSHSIIDRDWLLMKKLPGIALSESALYGRMLDKFFHKLGVYIKNVHEIKNDWFGYPEGCNTSPKEKNWYQAFKIMWNNLLDDILRTGIYTEKDKQWLSSLLEKNKKSFNHGPEPCLLHMDIWAQNILCDSEGNITGIVDWDRGLWGDIEIEFSVCEYCGTSPKSFFQGYGKEPEKTSDYKIRRNFYLLYEHQKYIFIRSMRNNNLMLAKNHAYESLNMAKSLNF